MNYTQKLTLSMLVPTVMVAGAGSAVVAGAWWLTGQARQVPAETLVGYLATGGTLTALLTVICVVACMGFTIWIRRTARAELGGEPSEASRVLAELADGNLSLTIAQAPPGSLLHSLARLVEVLRSTMGDIRHATQSIASASSEIATGNQDLSVRTEQSAGNLQRTASSIDNITHSAKQSADASRQAVQLAASAAEVAARGGDVVGQVVSTMEEISQSSRKISDIIGVIDSIAFQTNILALNAAVEAARAGEQGRGFAVVASEVRLLASRSAQAASEIKDLIGSSVHKVEAGSRQVQSAGTTMLDIVGSVKRVGDIIEEITAVSTEQSHGIDDVNAAISQLDKMTQQNAALVEESAAAAESLKNQAQNLARAVGKFRT